MTTAEMVEIATTAAPFSPEPAQIDVLPRSERFKHITTRALVELSCSFENALNRQSADRRYELLSDEQITEQLALDSLEQQLANQERLDALNKLH